MRRLVLEGECYRSFIVPFGKPWEQWDGKSSVYITEQDLIKDLRAFDTRIMKEYSIEPVRNEGSLRYESLRYAIVHDELKCVEWVMSFG